MSGGFYEWLREVRCTTVREVMERFSVTKTPARKRLKRLERRGVLEVRKVGRVAVYCIKKGAQLPLSRRKRIRTKIVQRAEQAAELLATEGCASTATLMHRLGLTHTQAFYILRLLKGDGRAVEVLLGRSAIWCRDRETAEELIRQLRDAAHRLVASSGLRYITPAKLLRMMQTDKETHVLFAKFVPLGRFDGDRMSPAALTFANSILRSLYGEPVRNTSNKHVYFVLPHPRQDVGVMIKDGASRPITVSLPPDLAAALEEAEKRGVSAEEVVIQAIEQLLERHK